MLVWRMVQLFPQAIPDLVTLLTWRVREARASKRPAVYLSRLSLATLAAPR